MRPTLAATDHRDRGPTHAEDASNLLMRQSLSEQPSDLDYVGLDQLGESVSLSAIRSSVPDAIGLVLGGSAPTEILKPVVSGVPIKMSAFHSGGARADKGFENKPVNLHVSAASSGAEIDVKTPVPVDVRPENAPDSRAARCRGTLDVPTIRNLVGSFVSDDGRPVFSVDSGSNRGDSHDQSVSKSARKSSQRIARSFLFVRDVVRVVKNVLAAS